MPKPALRYRSLPWKMANSPSASHRPTGRTVFLSCRPCKGMPPRAGTFPDCRAFSARTQKAGMGLPSAAANPFPRTGRQRFRQPLLPTDRRPFAARFVRRRTQCSGEGTPPTKTAKPARSLCSGRAVLVRRPPGCAGGKALQRPMATKKPTRPGRAHPSCQRETPGEGGAASRSLEDLHDSLRSGAREEKGESSARRAPASATPFGVAGTGRRLRQSLRAGRPSPAATGKPAPAPRHARPSGRRAAAHGGFTSSVLPSAPALPATAPPRHPAFLPASA